VLSTDDSLNLDSFGFFAAGASAVGDAKSDTDSSSGCEELGKRDTLAIVLDGRLAGKRSGRARVRSTAKSARTPNAMVAAIRARGPGNRPQENSDTDSSLSPRRGQTARARSSGRR
jgi:hypothetical protein